MFSKSTCGFFSCLQSVVLFAFLKGRSHLPELCICSWYGLRCEIYLTCLKDGDTENHWPGRWKHWRILSRRVWVWVLGKLQWFCSGDGEEKEGKQKNSSVTVVIVKMRLCSSIDAIITVFNFSQFCISLCQSAQAFSSHSFP